MAVFTASDVVARMRLVGDTWKELPSINAAEFPHSVAIAVSASGNFVAVGRIVEGENARTEQQVAPKRYSLITDVDISGSVLVAGDYSSDNRVGTAYVFEKDSTGFPTKESALLQAFDMQ